MAEVPLYDPNVHDDPDQVVRVEMWCQCTAAHRQVDPLAYIRPIMADFAARHSGEGHGPMEPGEAMEERNARRQAALRAAGRQGEFKEKAYDVPDEAALWDWSTLVEKKKG